MPVSFQDRPGAAHHDRFQKWRRDNPTGFVLAFLTKRRARLHTAGCPHFGNDQWTTEAVGQSLTVKRKVCDLTADLLLEWARTEGIEVLSCSDCLRPSVSLPQGTPAQSEDRPEPPERSDAELTAFSWGYWGWGNTVERFLEAAAAFEESRGFEPPAFADVRLRRNVRAAGFNGAALEKLVGTDRYRWFQGLGNANIGTDDTSIRIARPAEVDSLLDYVLEQSSLRRRVLFFCACQVVQDERCHRSDVGALLIQAARARKIDLTIIEWPGGEPQRRDVWLSDDQWDHITPISVPLGTKLPPDGIAMLPWGTAVCARCGSKTKAFLTGPAVFEGQWKLKIREQLDEADSESSALTEKAWSFRDRYRCSGRRT